jgi:hypothetical protein
MEIRPSPRKKLSLAVGREPTAEKGQFANGATFFARNESHFSHRIDLQKCLARAQNRAKNDGMNTTLLDEEMDVENLPAGFSVNKCEDRLLWDRVRRAAKFSGRTVREFCWHAIAGDVNMNEDDMIFDPNGEVIGDNLDLDELRFAANGGSFD